MSRPEEMTDPIASVAAEQPSIRADDPAGALGIAGTAPLLMGVKFPIRVLMGRTQLCFATSRS